MGQKKMWQPNIATGPSHRDPTSISWTIKKNYDLYCLYSGHYSWPKAAGIHDWRALAEISRRRTSSGAYLTRPAKCGLKMEKWQLKWQYATKCHQPKMNYFVAWFQQKPVEQKNCHRPPRADLFQWCFGDHIPGQAGLVQHDVAGLQHEIGEFSTGFRLVLDDGCEIVPKCLKLQNCNNCGPWWGSNGYSYYSWWHLFQT